MKQNLKFILAMVVLLVMAIVSFSSCEKEEASGGGRSDSLPNVIYAPVKGENLEWAFNAPTPSLSKGFWTHDSWELGKAYCKDDRSHSFVTMKVYRRNDPDKYFFVMLTNLDIKADKHCWAYNDDERNVGKYGYLYTWMKAKELGEKVYMELQGRNRRGDIIPKKICGRLMTFEDVKDILEADVVPEHDYEGNQLNGNNLPATDGDLYYDAFVFGVEKTDDFDGPAAQHTLGGNRNTEWNTQIDRYGGLNSWGNFWLDEKEYNPDYHYFLTVLRGGGKQKFDYSAYANHMINDYNGLSVRYVFEPDIW